eukprot:39309-Eustigmatos_ZCMA.PRE.1
MLHNRRVVRRREVVAAAVVLQGTCVLCMPGHHHRVGACVTLLEKEPQVGGNSAKGDHSYRRSACSTERKG